MCAALVNGRFGVLVLGFTHGEIDQPRSWIFWKNVFLESNHFYHISKSALNLIAGFELWAGQVLLGSLVNLESQAFPLLVTPVLIANTK
jgi:hypothetical protein